MRRSGMHGKSRAADCWAYSADVAAAVTFLAFMQNALLREPVTMSIMSRV